VRPQKISKSVADVCALGHADLFGFFPQGSRSINLQASSAAAGANSSFYFLCLDSSNFIKSSKIISHSVTNRLRLACLWRRSLPKTTCAAFHLDLLGSTVRMRFGH